MFYCGGLCYSCFIELILRTLLKILNIRTNFEFESAVSNKISNLLKCFFCFYLSCLILEKENFI